VREHFDAAAAGFDDNLQQLEYRAPELVAAALKRMVGERALAVVLDAGCGTGLCGPLIRAMAVRLAGVDLSVKMIDRARTRSVYDELHVAELSTFLRANSEAFDAIVSADTLVYFGGLDEPLRAAQSALRRDGLLIFTLESLNGEAARDEHRLQFHGRYAHSETYVRRAVQDAGLAMESLCHETLRRERLEPVNGFVVTARRER
jgi:predicted TPR repeat methyltransferase